MFYSMKTTRINQEYRHEQRGCKQRICVIPEQKGCDVGHDAVGSGSHEGLTKR